MDSWDCGATEKIIEDHLTGEAEAAAWEAAMEHAAGCAECGPKIEKAKKLTSLLERSMKAMGAAVAKKTIEAEVEKVLALPASRRLSERVAIRRRRYAYVAMAAAVVLIMLALYFAYGALLKIQKATPAEMARFQVNAMSKAVALLRNPDMPRSNDRRFVVLLEPEIKKHLSPEEFPSILENRFFDPWGQPYIVKHLSDKTIVYSIGKNRVDEACGGDDIIPTN
ncbi:MAG: hypothetical protein ACYS8W_02300 [Planctomycetota bacterium]|jgi:hypothetical protein